MILAYMTNDNGNCKWGDFNRIIPPMFVIYYSSMEKSFPFLPVFQRPSPNVPSVSSGNLIDTGTNAGVSSANVMT